MGAAEDATAPEPAPVPNTPGLLRALAAGRREYAERVRDVRPDYALELLASAGDFETAASVAEGCYGALYDILPSWRWTDAMVTRLVEAGTAAATWADVAELAAPATPGQEVPR